jgi:hypothetical protein
MYISGRRCYSDGINVIVVVVVVVVQATQHASSLPTRYCAQATPIIIKIIWRLIDDYSHPIHHLSTIAPLTYSSVDVFVWVSRR